MYFQKIMGERKRYEEAAETDSGKGRYGTKPELQRLLFSSFGLQRKLVLFSKACSIIQSQSTAGLQRKDVIRQSFSSSSSSSYPSSSSSSYSSSSSPSISFASSLGSH